MWRRAITSLLVLAAFSIPAQDFRVTASLNAFRQPQISFIASTNSYYAVYRSAASSDPFQPIAVFLVGNTNGFFVDTNAPSPHSFYRVRQIPVTQPLDLDQDGIDDLYELRYPAFLNPLKAADAALDYDHDGATNLQEYQAGTDPTRAPGGSSLVINEVDYDNIGTDNAEFIEIFNKSSLQLDLTGLALILINGANNTEYARYLLSGSLAANQYLVLASSNVVVASGALVTNVFTVNGIQNGAPDGIALFDTRNNVLLDALSYEGSITMATITGVPGFFNLVEGTALNSGVADSNTIQGALIRNPNGTDTDNAASDWKFSTTPTPGGANTP